MHSTNSFTKTIFKLLTKQKALDFRQGPSSKFLTQIFPHIVQKEDFKIQQMSSVSLQCFVETNFYVESFLQSALKRKKFKIQQFFFVFDFGRQYSAVVKHRDVYMRMIFCESFRVLREALRFAVSIRSSNDLPKMFLKI